MKRPLTACFALAAVFAAAIGLSACASPPQPPAHQLSFDLDAYEQATKHRKPPTFAETVKID